ncbi:MAG: DUF975 family protein [Clostridia bacterium]|nr:DUF975 family protein [Clostridia bacterium]
MIDRITLKNMAKEQIKGNIGVLFVILLIALGISTVAAMIPMFGWFASGWIAEPAFALSLFMIYLDLVKGIKPEISRVFDGFYDLWSSIKVSFFVGVFTLLWSLLFVIPGIVKAYSYSMAYYILAENKGMPALEAIRRSQEIMDGHKMDLFVLSLSFIGWNILGIITFGVAYIWVAPYMLATLTNFYNEIKNEKFPITVETDNFVVVDAQEETEE